MRDETRYLVEAVHRLELSVRTTGTDPYSDMGMMLRKSVFDQAKAIDDLLDERDRLTTTPATDE